MQINGVKGWRSLIVSVWNSCFFKATLESVNMFYLLFGMRLTIKLLIVNVIPVHKSSQELMCA